jgi:hypothetical protein
MLLLAPASAAKTRLAHHANGHIGKPPILLVQRLNLLQPLDLQINPLNLLHQLYLIRSAVDIDPF